MKLKFISALALGLVLFASPALAAGKVRVVTTTTDLAAIARAIGGDKVEATPLAKGYADIHFFEARPSDVIKIRRADVWVQMGLGLDTVWSRGLLDAARNSRMVRVDASRNIPVLEKPTGPVNRSMGDVHPDGNPHYQLDPENGHVIAANILAGLEKADPADAAYFEKNKAAFDAELDRRIKGWQARMASAKGANVIDYHKELAYFAHRFGLNVVGYVEPKPGVAPTPVHTRELMRLVKAQHVKAIVMESWYDASTPKLIQRETGVPYVVIPTSVGGESGVDTYFDLFDRIVDKLEGVLK